MKKVLYTLSAALLALLAVSCDKYEKAVFKASDATPPVIKSIAAGKTIKITYDPAVIEMSFNEKMNVYHTIGLVAIGQAGESGEVEYKTVNQTLSGVKDDATNHVVSVASDNVTNALLARGYNYGDALKLKLVVRASIQDPAKGVTNGYVDSKEVEEIDFKLKKPSGGAYAAFTEVSPWSVIGSIASTGNSWNADSEMATDGTWHVCEGLELTTSDEFKFRKDASWDTNFGGDFVMLDSEFAVEQNGPNIKVTEDGLYDLLLNPDAGVAKIVVHKEDPYAKYNQESPWSVIGSIASTGNSWNADEEMASDGTWHLCRGLELTTSDEFKFRKDAGWTVNFGGDFVALGEEFSVTQDGPNIKVLEDGTYDLYLNPDGEVAKIVKAGEVQEDKPQEPEPERIIKIDGDMSDWAEIEGVETPDAICREMKVINDDDYFFVYLKSIPGSRGSQLWGEAAGYYYIDFDWDNNEETGIPENSNPGFDCWCYLYIFGGSAEEPVIKENPNGDGQEMSIENIKASGVITEELIEIELSIPRADMVAVEAGTETRILSWRSKDGTKISMTYTVK